MGLLTISDPLGDLARDYAGRSGPGSGKHWSDGIYNSDWSLWDGSASYKEGIAQGFPTGAEIFVIITAKRKE